LATVRKGGGNRVGAAQDFSGGSVCPRGPPRNVGGVGGRGGGGGWGGGGRGGPRFLGREVWAIPRAPWPKGSPAGGEYKSRFVFWARAVPVFSVMGPGPSRGALQGSVFPAKKKTGLLG